MMSHTRLLLTLHFYTKEIIRFEWMVRELINVKPDRTRRAHMSEANFYII